MPDSKPKAKSPKPQLVQEQPSFPQKVRISGKKHPHQGKTGIATGETTKLSGLTEEMLLVELDEGEQVCYVLPADLTLLGAQDAVGKPNRRQAEAQAKKKAKPKVTNGGAAGNAIPLDLLQNPVDGEPLAESGKRARKPRQPQATCGAEGKRGAGPCRHPAGFRTDHPGEGRCYLHGGRSPSPTGRYSQIKRPRFQELLREFADDPDPLNLLHEVLLLRTLLTDFIDRWDRQDEMLTRWNLSFEKAFQSAWAEWWREARANILEMQDDLTLEEEAAKMPDPMEFLPSKPLRMADITEAAGLIDKVGGMVDRIHKHSKGKTFDMATIDRLWTAMSAHLTQAMLEVIEDHDLRQRLHTSVAEKWAGISLAELASGGSGESQEEG